MLNNIRLYQYFLVAILISPFLGYFSGTGLIAYGPIIFFTLCILFIEILYPTKMLFKDWGAVLIWLPYVILASYYYISYPLEGRYLTTHLLAIITLPLITLSILRLKSNLPDDNYSLFLYKIIYFFLVAELVICLGQISTYTFGLGLPINEVYKDYFMITGTFYNSNDLGAIVLLIAFLFINIEDNHSLRQQGTFWFLVILLLLISGSRSALLTVGLLFIITRKLNIKTIFLYSTIFITFFTVYNIFFIESNSNIVLRFVNRAESLITILKEGVGIDGSMGLRFDSYVHFIKNWDQLGIGSGKINDYFQYVGNANFNSVDLMFQNPHSLIVELGYWLGWPGLVCFFIAIFYLLQYSNKKIFVLIVVGVASFIPSSVLGNVIFFLMVILNLFMRKKSK